MAIPLKKLAFQCGLPREIGRDEIRQRRHAAKENDPDSTHLCSRNALQPIDLNASPPCGYTFVEFTASAGAANRDPLLLELQDDMRLMKEALSQHQVKIGQQQEEINVLQVKNGQQQEEINVLQVKNGQQQEEINVLQTYQALETTRDQVAASLLNDISAHLDSWTTFVCQETGDKLERLEEEEERKKKSWYGKQRSFKRGDARRVSYGAFLRATRNLRGYRNLIRKADGMKGDPRVDSKMKKQMYDLLEGVERAFLRDHSGFQIELSGKQLRDAMRSFYKLDGVKARRDLGAHLFDMQPRGDNVPASFVEQRKRNQLFAIADIQEAVRSKSFVCEHLHADSVSQTLLAACKIHQQLLEQKTE